LQAAQTAALNAYAWSFRFVWIFTIPFTAVALLSLFFLYPVRNEMNGIVDRPNKNVEVSAYTDPIDPRAAQALVDAGDAVRYDLSDPQPTEFGATTGQGIWGILTDFVSDPSDVEGTAQQLEAAAKDAYK